jgi:glycosyltransferase involved in cell wall biosynthesis
VSSNTPLDPQFSFLRKSKQKGIPFYFWLQDVTGLATYVILRKKIPLLGILIGKYYIYLERRILRQSDKIILITEDFLTLLKEWGIDQSKAVVIPNWAPIDQISLQPKDNPWTREHELIGKFCFMYTGTLGLKHNPDLLLELARHYQNEKNISIVVISETMGANWLKSKKEELSLDNLLILDFQPFDEMQYVLASADVLIAILEEDAGVYSVPSKVLTYLCSQRPLLLAVPEENLAARIVNSSQSGIVVRSNDSTQIIHAADQLLRNPAECKRFGENARRYAELNFDIRIIADQFEDLFIS